MTGWKIGWACGPAELVAAVRGAKQFMTFAGGTPLQHAAAVALGIAEEHGARLAAELKAKRDRLCDGLERAGFEVLRPAGTYFVNVDVGEDAVAFCRELPERAGVVGDPHLGVQRRPRARPDARALRVLQARGGHRRGRPPARRAALSPRDLRVVVPDVLVTLEDLEPRAVVRKVITGMEEQDLLTYASAIAFQTLTSLIPLALLTLSIMGFLDLGDVWTNDLAPQVKEQVSPEVFAVIDDVAQRTLSSGQGWWLTRAWCSRCGRPRASRGRSWARSRASTATARTARSCAATWSRSGSASRSRCACSARSSIVRFGSHILGLDDAGWAGRTR